MDDEESLYLGYGVTLDVPPLMSKILKFIGVLV